MLPFLAFPFFIGWCLSCTGEKSNFQTKSPRGTFSSTHSQVRHVQQRNIGFMNAANQQNFAAKEYSINDEPVGRL
jgi:hypothetical protein